MNEVDYDVATSTYANRYQHTDALGSPVVVTNGPHAVLERNEYEPYGQVLAGGNADRPGYTGHVKDAQTGLNYMQQRYYDPQIGRFLSVDPVTAYSNGDSRYFNRYWYAAGNPYKFTDPDGRWFGVAAKVVKVIAKGGNVAATVAGAVEDAKTLVSRDATLGQRAAAGASLLSEVFSPVSARDAKAVVNAVEAAGDSRTIYRTGSQTDGALTQASGVSFRDSVSSAADGTQTFKPGAKCSP